MLMKKTGTSATVYPPITSTCPDYWQVDGSYCVVPHFQSLNTGTLYDMSGNLTIPTSTYGVKQVNYADISGNFHHHDSYHHHDHHHGSKNVLYNPLVTEINFTDSGWANGAVTNICNQKKWANLNGIVWDGVTNYNSC